MRRSGHRLKVNWLKRTGSVVQIRQRGDVVIPCDGRASIDAWPRRALRKEKTRLEPELRIRALVLNTSTLAHRCRRRGVHPLH